MKSLLKYKEFRSINISSNLYARFIHFSAQYKDIYVTYRHGANWNDVVLHKFKEIEFENEGSAVVNIIDKLSLHIDGRIMELFETEDIVMKSYGFRIKLGSQKTFKYPIKVVNVF